MVNSYTTYKMIMKFLRDCPFVIKCTIDEGKVSCENNIIKKDIEKQLTAIEKTIVHITFYTFYETDKIVHMLNELPFNLFPVYKKNNNFKNFIYDFQKFSIVDIRAYATRTFEEDTHDYTDLKSCQSIVRHRSNPEFSTFTQYVFHAGSEYQVNRYGIMMMNSIFKFNSKINTTLIQYDRNAILNTINYTYSYLKKGVLVGIKNNKLVIFLPMTNTLYKNDYVEELYFDKNDKKNLEKLKREPNNKKLLKQTESTVNYYFNKLKISKTDIILDRRKWYLNGCLIRNDTYEGDKLIILYLDFFTELLKVRQINDCVFILNTRDFPILRKDRRHPNIQVIDRSIPKKYKKPFCPILSVGIAPDHDDIPLITQDDWMRVSKRFYPESCVNRYLDPINKTPWKAKINKVVFRGTASGCGITVDDNMRLKVMKIAEKYPDLFDVGLTNFNYRIKKKLNRPIQILDSNKYKKGTFIDNDTKMTFKYILNIDGHVMAFRIGYELQLECVILLVESNNKIWLSEFLIPYVHYVPIKSDLSDIIEIIEWCKQNDDKCLQISKNALKLYNEKLGKDNLFDYTQNKLNKFSLINSPSIPTTYKIAKKIGIVACYRDNETHTRYSEMIQYVYHISKMLENTNVDYRIIIAEQSSTDKFNIGKIKNVGFKYLREKEPDIEQFIFTDIDMIPNHELLPYFTKITDGIGMLAINGTRYISKTFLGGCISISKNTFESINGYSNIFDQGWGSEDTNLKYRCIEEKLKFYNPKHGSVIDMEDDEYGKCKRIPDKKKQMISDDEYNMKQYEMIMNYKDYPKDGIGNCIYELLHESFNDKTYRIIIDAKHEKQRKTYPELYDFSSFVYENYEKLYEEMSLKILAHVVY